MPNAARRRGGRGRGYNYVDYQDELTYRDEEAWQGSWGIEDEVKDWSATSLAPSTAPTPGPVVRTTRKEDWDPPPHFDTTNLRKDWPTYRRRLEVWKLNTDMPANRPGGKLLAALGGKAAEPTAMAYMQALAGQVFGPRSD